MIYQERGAGSSLTDPQGQGAEARTRPPLGFLIPLSWVVALGPSGYVAAQVAGSTTLGVAVKELKAVALGWIAKKEVLDQSVSFVIVAAGGSVGLGRHDVAIPVSQLKQQDGKFVLPNAT